MELVYTIIVELTNWIGQFDVELANLVKLASSVVHYQRIGQFAKLTNSILQST
jgi:hypothetical protein